MITNWELAKEGPRSHGIQACCAAGLSFTARLVRPEVVGWWMAGGRRVGKVIIKTWIDSGTSR